MTSCQGQKGQPDIAIKLDNAIIIKVHNSPANEEISTGF
jgi:hypothetical protein